MESSPNNLNDAASCNQTEQNLRSQLVIGNDAPSSVSNDETSTLEPSIPSTWSGYSLKSDSTEQSEGQSEDVGTSKLAPVVWQHMKRVTVNGELMAVCKYCKRKLSARKGSGTKHLLAHVDSCLRKNIGFIRKAYQKEYVVGKKPDGKTTIHNCFNLEESRRFLVRKIVMQEYPLSIVGQVEFKQFVQSLQPLFLIPSRNMVMNDVIELYKEQMENTMSLLDNNKGRVAITTDMWTVDNQNKGYMAVTASFVDGSWQLQQRLLRYISVPTPHTIDVISEQLLNAILDWNLANKLSTTTVPNCSVYDGAIESVAQKLDKNELLLGGSVLHMHCYAHVLNLNLKDVFDIIGPSLENIRSSCVFWSKTSKRLEKFEEAAHRLCITSTKKLCFDVKTRWNSTYIMLETAILFKDVFDHLRKYDSLYNVAPSEEDWENAKMICERLAIFSDLIELFSGTNYPSPIHCFSNICEIMIALSTWLLDSNPTIANMASIMLKKFDNYLKEVHRVMGIAVILDPRLKTLILKFYYEKLYGANHMNEVDTLVNLFRELFREYQKKEQEAEKISSGGDEGTGKNKLMTRYDLFRQEQKRQRIHSSIEFDRYLEEDVIPFIDDFDVLDWWKVNGCRFPILQKVARDIYAIPFFTVASESAFSLGGQLVSPQRDRLHPELFDNFYHVLLWFLN